MHTETEALAEAKKWLSLLRGGTCFQYRVYRDYIEDGIKKRQYDFLDLGITQRAFYTLLLSSSIYSIRHWEKVRKLAEERVEFRVFLEIARELKMTRAEMNTALHGAKIRQLRPYHVQTEKPLEAAA